MPHPPRPPADLPRRPAAGRPRPRAPFWTPWLCAPLFAGLPIVGCGLATPAVDPPRALSGGRSFHDHASPGPHAAPQRPFVPIGAVVPLRTVAR